MSPVRNILFPFMICCMMIHGCKKDNAQLTNAPFYIEDAIGIGQPGSQHNTVADVEFRMAGGLTWVRRDVNWYRSEQVLGVYDFSRLDEAIDLETSMGVNVLGILDYGHPEYNSLGIEKGPPDNVEDFGNYVYEAVTYFKGRIKVWEIWNEPNFGFWWPEPNYVEYGELAREAIKAIKRADPTVKILLGGMIGNVESIFNLGEDFVFLQDLARDFPDVFHDIDYLALHPYTWLQNVAPEIQSGYVNGFQISFTDMIANMRNAAALSGKTDLPIWITEYGWHTAENSAIFEGVSEADQASYLVRGALLAFSKRVEKVMIYTYMDGGGDETNKESHFGLLQNSAQGEPLEGKPAYHAVKNLYNQLLGMAFIRDLSEEMDLPPRVYAYLFRDASGRELITAWTRNNDFISMEFEDAPATVIDLLGNQLTSGTQVELTTHPVFIHLN